MLLEKPSEHGKQIQPKASSAPEPVLPPVAGADNEKPTIERRRDPRYPTRDFAEVEIFPQATVREGAMILDVSRSGLRVHLKHDVPKGTHLRIRLLKTHLVIFGEVRYCRASDDGFDIGVWIEHMFNAREELGKHIHDVDLDLYVMGKGLSVEEVILLKDHLITCEICQARVAKKEATLRPIAGLKLKTRASASHK